MTQYKVSWKTTALLRTCRRKLYIFLSDIGTSILSFLTFTFWLWFPNVQLIWIKALRPRPGTYFLFVWDKDQHERSQTHNGRVTPLWQRKWIPTRNSNTPDLTPIQLWELLNRITLHGSTPTRLKQRQYNITRVHELFRGCLISCTWQGCFMA